MTGAREGKFDGSKQQDSRAALFPRLHVAETKRAGPRGPPRNKMALFEQLTIPSHKFKPSLMPLPSSGRAMKSPAMTTPLYLPIPQVTAGSHDSMYSYVPMSYMNPTMMQTMACIPGYSYSGLFSSETTSSMNTSGSKGAVTERAAESPSVGGAGPKTLSQANYQTPFKNGREDDEFAVPTYSSVTQSSEQTARPSSPIHVQKTPRGQRALPRVKGPVTQKPFPIAKDKCMEVTSSEHKDDGRWSTASGECVTASVIGNEVDLQETDFSKLERIPSSESHPSTAPADKVCRADSLTTRSEQDMLSNVSSDNQREEGSELSQQRRDSSTETGSSMLDNASAGSVQFQDVVHAFGQREFWKTQTIVIRQQRIFSRQVFELHRVLEVQQLLAKTLGLPPSIDEALEKEDDNVHMAESPIAEVPDVPQAESPVAEVPEIPLIAEALEVPEIPKRCPEPKALSENSMPDLDPPHQPMDPLHIPMQQVFNPDAPWPAPPYAANPWAVRMASPFMYVPCPGSYPAGYGTYPMMGAPMPMYAPPGAQQPVRFPTWQQQSGMPMLMNAQDSPAMAAWYGQQVPAGVQAGGPARAPAGVQASSPARAPAGAQVGDPARAPAGVQASGPARAPAGVQAGGPARAPAGVQAGGPARAPAGILIAAARNDSPACHLERLASSGFDQAIESTSDITDARQAGQDGERSGVGVNMSKESVGEVCDWAKGWGRREGRWVRGDRSLVHKKVSDVADLRGKEADCQNGDTAREGELTGRGGLHPANGSRPVDDSEVCREGHQEGVGSLKHMRSEGAFDPGVCRWFPILSPPKRPMHHNGVIKVVPRAVSAAPELAANILLSIQTDRQR